MPKNRFGFGRNAERVNWFMRKLAQNLGKSSQRDAKPSVAMKAMGAKIVVPQFQLPALALRPLRLCDDCFVRHMHRRGAEIARDCAKKTQLGHHQNRSV